MTHDTVATLVLLAILAFTAVVAYGFGNAHGHRDERRQTTRMRRAAQLARIREHRNATWDERT